MRFINTRGQEFNIQLNEGEVQIIDASNPTSTAMNIAEYVAYASVPWEEAYLWFNYGEIYDLLSNVYARRHVRMLRIDPDDMNGVPLNDGVTNVIDKIRKIVWMLDDEHENGVTYYMGRIYVLTQQAYLDGIDKAYYTAAGYDSVTGEPVQIFWRILDGYDPEDQDESDACDWDFAERVNRL